MPAAASGSDPCGCIPPILEQAAVAERERYHRRGKVRFIAILVEAQARGRPVEIDQAALGRVRVSREIAPGLERERGDRWPGQAGLRMVLLVPIAALVRDPAQGAAIGHANGQRTAAERHARDIRWCATRNRANVFKQACLCGLIEITGHQPEAGKLLGGGHGQWSVNGAWFLTRAWRPRLPPMPCGGNHVTTGGWTISGTARAI